MNADAIYVRGLCLYYEDNVDRPFSHFQQVLRFAPDHTKAKEAYKKAKQLKLKKEEGNTAFKAGQLTEALRLYTEALGIDAFNRTTNSKLYFNRATVHAKLSKLENSIEDCTKAIDLDSTYIKAYLRRAKSYMDTEQYEEAVRDYEHVFKTDKSNREYRQMLQNAKLGLRKSKRKDYYKVLGIDKNANEEEIKKAYRKRAMDHHPDRHSGATEQEKKDHETKFKEIGEAYTILSDEKKRRAYDSGQDMDDMGGGHQGFHDIDPNTIFQAFFGGGGMGGGMPGGGHQHYGGFGGAPGGGQSFSFQFG
jgi:DnaJ family protein C protein 7